MSTRDLIGGCAKQDCLAGAKASRERDRAFDVFLALVGGYAAGVHSLHFDDVAAVAFEAVEVFDREREKRKGGAA